MQQARQIWRDAIEAVVLRRGEHAPERVLAWYDDRPRSKTDSSPSAPKTTKSGRPYSMTPTAIAKRKSRAKRDVWERERDAAEAKRRAQGVRAREEWLDIVRARSEATREEREARHRAQVAAYQAKNREVLLEEQRQRRAAMTLEERRAEWLRHQHARRAKLRAAREAAREAAE